MKVLSLTLVAGLAVSSAFAETWYYMAPNTTDTYGLQKCNSWTNSAGANPTGSGGTYTPKAGDVHYLYGRCLDGSTLVSMTARNKGNAFAGTLYLGTADPNVAAEDRKGNVFNKYVANYTTYGNLVLVDGAYRSVNTSTGSDNSSKIAGTVTVQSPEANPFLFTHNDTQSKLGFRISAAISGETGTAIWFLLAKSQECNLELSGDNSGYAGQMKISSDKFSSGKDDWQVTVASANALGGACDAADANAIDVSFKGTARLIFTPDVGAKIAAENRGLMTSYREDYAGNGALYLEMQEGVDVDFALPIAGETPVTKTGPGRLTLSGAYTSTGALSCEEGILVLTSPTAMAKAGVANDTVWIKSPGTAPFEVTDVAFDGARVIVTVDGANVGTCALGKGCTMTAAKTTLVLATDDADKLYSGADTAELCLIKIPSSVRATVTEADFDVDLSALPYGLPRYQVEVRDVTGGRGVYLVRRYPVVVRAAGDPNATESATTLTVATDKNGVNIWSDGEAVHAGSDYLMPSNSVRTADSSTFAGESLTLADGAILILKSTPMTVGTLFLRPGGEIKSGTVSTKTKAPLAFYGDVYVSGTQEQPSYISARSDGPLLCRAALHGSGFLALVPVPSDNGYNEVTLLGDNTDFTGRMLVSRTASSGVARGESSLFVNAPEGLGGALPSFDYAALTMSNATVLQPTNAAVTLATANRGVLIREAVAVKVPESFTLTIDEPVTFNGALTKSGNGSLWLGGRTWFENSTEDGVTETPTADKNKLVITEGELGGTPQAFSNLAVTVSGGALRLDPTIGGDCGILPQSLTVSAATLDIAVSTEADAVEGALLTVDDATATALAGKVRVCDPAHLRHRIAYGFVAAKGLPGYQTLTMSYAKGGLAVIIR